MIEQLKSHWAVLTAAVTLAFAVVYAENLKRDQALINDALMDAIATERVEHNRLLLTVEEVRTAQGEIIGRLSADGSMPYRLGYDVGLISCEAQQ